MYWNTDNPLKPWGYFDPNAQLDIPFDWTAWLAELGVNYASHLFILPAELEEVSSGQNAGIITIFVKVAAGQTVVAGTKYPVTCRITTDGTPPRKDDRTVYLKMFER
jgi:hypothetical protein